ncbi:MAG: methyltransferase domain-containing protein [Thermoproteus sp.]
MRVAISETKGRVDGPGEAEEIAIYDVEGGSYKLVERLENPAKYARMARGAAALAEAHRRGAQALIVSEIGPRGFEIASRWGMKIYIYEGLAEEALDLFAKGALKEATGPTHGEHHHHGGHWRGVSEEEYALLIRYTPKGGVAADLGCGAGRLCEVLKDLASRVYCVDIDADALREVEKIGSPNLVILNEDVRRTTIPGGVVDVVVMSNVLHDLDDKNAAVREIARILRPGGYAIVIEHKPGSLFGPPSFLKMSPDDVRKHFVGGFKEVEYVDLGHNYALVFQKA